MLDVLADPIAELEEHFDLEIPCGGNSFPVNRPCPHGAAATLRFIHHPRCRDMPQSLKCNSCHQEWLSGCRAEWYSGIVGCVCGAQLPAEDCYRAI